MQKQKHEDWPSFAQEDLVLVRQEIFESEFRVLLRL